MMTMMMRMTKLIWQAWSCDQWYQISNVDLTSRPSWSLNLSFRVECIS